MENKLIGLMGPARSGKDSVADILVEEHGFKKRAFASPLKYALWHYDTQVQDLIPSNADHEWEAAKGIPSAERVLRRKMQSFGSALRAGFGPDVLVAPIRDYLNRTRHNVVVTDVRMLGEAELILSHGGVLWCVSRENALPPTEDITDKSLNYHCVRIYNNGSLDDLRQTVKELL